MKLIFINNVIAICNKLLKSSEVLILNICIETTISINPTLVKREYINEVMIIMSYQYQKYIMMKELVNISKFQNYM